MARGYGIPRRSLERWRAQRRPAAKAIVLAKKVYQPMGTGPNDRRRRRPNPRSLRGQPAGGCRRSHTALYQMHHIDRLTPWDEDLAGNAIAGTARQVIYVGRAATFAAGI